jgi:hypothetical protein
MRRQKAYIYLEASVFTGRGSQKADRRFGRRLTMFKDKVAMVGNLLFAVQTEATYFQVSRTDEVQRQTDLKLRIIRKVL